MVPYQRVLLLLTVVGRGGGEPNMSFSRVSSAQHRANMHSAKAANLWNILILQDSASKPTGQNPHPTRP